MWVRNAAAKILILRSRTGASKQKACQVSCTTVGAAVRQRNWPASNRVQKSEAIDHAVHRASGVCHSINLDADCETSQQILAVGLPLDP
ncbi:hypothetical protein SAMN06265222_11943 [Neorhodopirellula lusitana]|uniref:Uncharacterized protein n=1 Tax=Neorhodopirellula lusitana TaxID=445327 RepID=A0ABY1QR96_9BACT|nr:hypothetical protein SAMN06265222_11943 [Neorhodopirellula lusitana]